jgi:hypothetical protein
MAMNTRITITILSIIALSFSCEERTDIPYKSVPTDLIAVEAVLTNENIVHTVTIKQPYQKQNGNGLAVTGATVSISDGSSTILLTPSDSGRYLTPRMRFLTGKTYSLSIIHNGKEFTAQDSAVPVESLAALSYSATDGGYRFNFFETGSQPNYINYNIDWSGTNSCTTNSCIAKLVYYDLKTVDANEIFKPSETDFVFASPSTVIRRKFSVSDQYRSYLRSMLSETKWRGSVFDVQRDNAPTNFSGGAIGFFAVSMVVSDTLKIQ